MPSLEELRHSFQGGLRCDPRGPAIGEAFNVMVDAVVRELMQLLREEMHLEGEELDEIMETRFAIFYVDDTHIVSGTLSSYKRQPEVSLQPSNVLVLRPSPR